MRVVKFAPLVGLPTRGCRKSVKSGTRPRVFAVWPRGVKLAPFAGGSANSRGCRVGQVRDGRESTSCSVAPQTIFRAHDSRVNNNPGYGVGAILALISISDSSSDSSVFRRLNESWLRGTQLTEAPGKNGF